ncbi:kinase binding protein CGI-121-domain-containing protein [Lentinula aciculospora]|uniref:EKC/KEOPS complex subunit CGI121 n=1 Tax=Lentinula aciculospora TaxID=153920 RepID=A0A9W9A2U1_9AGAR|nr:kinase binding protein CGI-121-domain-containing protein [Lentinula aciculospora]
METFQFNHNRVAYALLFSPVNDPGKIKQRIINAAKAKGREGDEKREAVNFSFINASLVTSRLHLETAINQAILAESQGSLRTKTVHSEILFALNPTNNITEAIRRYGVSDTSKALLVVYVGDLLASTSNVENKMEKVVDGTIVTFDKLAEVTDWDTLIKYHKVNVTEKDIRAQAFLDNVAISAVALKSVMQ